MIKKIVPNLSFSVDPTAKTHEEVEAEEPARDEEDVKSAAREKEIAESEVHDTVMKQIGGGAVPITPPSQIIQLQPIVVPIAIVPFASQSQNILQNSKNAGTVLQTPNAAIATVGKPSAANANQTQLYANKSGKGKSAVIMIFALLSMLPSLLAYFVAVPSFSLADINLIGKIAGFASGVQFEMMGNVPFIMLSVAFFVALIDFVFTLVTLIKGKYNKIGALVLSLFPALFLAGAAVYAYFPSMSFTAENKLAFIIPAAVSLIGAVLSIVFALGRKD